MEEQNPNNPQQGNPEQPSSAQPQQNNPEQPNPMQPQHQSEPETTQKEDEDEELTTDELAEHADDKVDALIQLLIKKGIITEEEFDKEYDNLFEEE